MAASVVGIRNLDDDVLGGGGEGGSAGINGPDGVNGPLVTGSNPTGINVAAIAGSSREIRGGASGGGGGVGGGGGGADAVGVEQQRGHRWGFGGGRESAGILLFGEMEGHTDMMEAVEAALGNGRRIGGRSAGAGGKRRMMPGADAGRSEGDIMDIRSARQVIVFPLLFPC